MREARQEKTKTKKRSERRPRQERQPKKIDQTTKIFAFRIPIEIQNKKDKKRLRRRRIKGKLIGTKL